VNFVQKCHDNSPEKINLNLVAPFSFENSPSVGFPSRDTQLGNTSINYVQTLCLAEYLKNREEAIIEDLNSFNNLG